MAKGIVRAADRVAVWHQAINDDDYLQQKYVSKPSATEPPTSTPPQGVEGPKIPNSNKFKIPANGLKKTLETTAHPSQGFHPESTKAVESWLQNKPDFTKTYFKPQYNEALKAHLGDENHAKLMHHAPTPYTDALTIHQQSPAPKSNKFTIPANGLKKLLEDPHTETSHVQSWLNTGQGAAFAKTYLKPGYADALKGHLGEKNYAELQNHLNPQEKAEEKAPSTKQMAPEVAEWVKGFGVNPHTLSPEKAQGWVDKWKEEGPHAQPQHQEGDSEYYQKLINAVAPGSGAGHVMNTPGFKKWLHEAYPNLDEHGGPYQNGVKKSPLALLNQYKDFQQSQPQEIEPEQSDVDHAQAIQQEQQQPDLDKVFSEAANPALYNDISKVFPNHGLDLYASHDEVKNQLEQWLKYLPDHEGYAAHVPQLQALYDQHFGGGNQPQSDEDHAQAIQDLQQPQQSFNAQQFAEDLGKIYHIDPSIIQGYGAGKKPKLYKDMSPEEAHATFKELQKMAPQEGLDELYDKHFGEGAQQPSVSGHPTPEQMHQALTADIFNLGSGSEDSLKAWLKKSPEEAKADIQSLANGQGTSGQTLDPQLQAKWQKVHDTLYGQDAQSPGGIDINTTKPDKAGLEKIFDHLWPELPGDKEAWVNHQLSKDQWNPEYFQENYPHAWAKAEQDLAGGAAQQPSGKPSFNLGKDTLSQDQLMALGIPEDEAAKMAKAGPGVIDSNVKFLTQNPEKQEKYPEWAKVIQWLNGGQQQPQQSAGPAPFNALDIAKAMQKADPHTFDDDWVNETVGEKGSPEDWKHHLQSLMAGNYPPEEKAQYKAILDTYFGNGAQQQQSGFSSGITNIPKNVFEQEVPMPLMDGGYDAKAPYKWAPGAQAWLAEQGITKPEDVKYGKLEQLYQTWHQMDAADKQKYIDMEQGGGPVQQQSVSPTEDDDLGSLDLETAKQKAIDGLINAGWPKSAMGLKKIQDITSPEELKNLLQGWSDNGYTGDLYNFLPQIINQLSGAAPEEEEGPQEPAKPFKSEQLNPEDINHWAQNKPQSPAEWKQFAQWWGNTQMPPEAETGLYKQWFGKDVAPEQAQDWFKQVFEHNSAPGEGDLGVEGVPGWAHNSWALGPKAEAEWPVFKAWATQHPGIPKGTSLKQKLSIWKSLSDEDKAQIAGDYAPENPVDTKSVVNALKTAYPDSDWSKWAKMPQGTLQKSLENLGKAGYGPAAQVYNQFFGGDLPVPEEPKEGAEPQAPTEQPLPPVESLPGWIQPQLQDKPPGQTAKLTKDYLNLAKFAESVGQGDLLNADYKTPELAQLGKIWQKLPPHIKAQLDQMDTMPWQDMAGFEQWKDAQPTITDALKDVMPNFSGAYFPWNTGSGYDNSKQQQLGEMIEKADSPDLKQKLLGIYHQFYGHGQTTLAESLKAVDPNQDWDKILQSKSKSQVASLIKKQLKTEQDPAKWAQWANAWAKHFPHPSKSHDIAPTGVKVLTDYFKSKYPGKLSEESLAQLHHYKTKYPNHEIDYVPYHLGKDSEHQEAGKQLAALDDGKSFLPYLGWTPPSGTSMGSYKTDPALYGNPGKATSYDVPEESQGSGNYKNLINKADGLKHLFSDKDRKILKSDGFRNWFNQAPKVYRSSIEANPGIALDDYESFMSGGQMYSDVPAGGATKKDKYYDLSPFALTPTKKDKGIPKSHQQNPKRWDEVKFPHYQDTQETLPLPGGEKWAPKYAPLPIYRVMNIDLDKSDHEAPSHITNPKDRQLFNQQQIARLRKIDQIVNGGPTARNPQTDLKHLKNWGSKYGLSDKEINDLASTMFSEQPDLFTDEKWKHLEDFARTKGIDPEEMHDLANKLEVTPPPAAKGNYEHPELAQLLLDYMEANAHRSSEGGPDTQGGLGWHWTRDKDKAYSGIPAAGEGALTTKPSKRKIPVALSALWGGQGEGAGHGGAYDPDDPRELEQNLRTHAPVHVRRLQIRSPDMDWHDLMDHGPMSLWPPGRNETAVKGKTVEDKPSLARELGNVLGTSQSKDLDTLVPGHQADAVFSKLIAQHPYQKKELLKLYRDFFVGRPELPTKPHTRRASVQHIPHLAALDESNPAHLYDLATSWGVSKPERYGLPYIKELASDLKGLGWGWKEVAKEHVLGRPNPRRGSVDDLERQIMRLAADHLPDPEWMAQYFKNGEYDTPDKIAELYQNNPNSWVFKQYDQDYADDQDDHSDEYYDDDEDDDGYDEYEPEDDSLEDDYEYSDDDFADPPLPTMDRPKGWPTQAPYLKNDRRNRQYFPPHGLNAPSSSEARPDIDWEEAEHEQDPLPFRQDIVPATKPGPGGQHALFDVGGGSQGYEWPKGVQSTPLYRGLMIDLGHKDLGHVRRALLGGQFEEGLADANSGGAGRGPFSNYSIAKPHPAGYDNPNLGEHLLNHVQNNPGSYEGNTNYGLGPHWSMHEGTAQSFAGQTTQGANHPLKLPTVIRAQWKGLGEDPYRTNTQGDWPEEGEVTMLPGAKMHVDSVKIQHPKTKQWHEVLGQPTQRHAKVEARKPRGILTHSEMRR